MVEGVKRTVFEDISPESSITEVESLCINCHQQGISKFMLIKIPHFKNVVVAAFECSHCGYSNNDLQTATSISDKGITYTLHITNDKDLSRQIVKNEFASLKFVEIDLEIPIKSGRSTLSTVEGLLHGIIEDLSLDQESRIHEDVEAWRKVNGIIDSLKKCLQGEIPLTLILDDISGTNLFSCLGNSYIEDNYFPEADPNLKVKRYEQDPKLLAEIGFASEFYEEAPEDVLCFGGTCPSCNRACQTRMHQVDIPFFREVIIMATTCDQCGYKSNEVKTGGPISEKGRRIKLRITDIEDMSRDILKSETCVMKIPEIELHLNTGTLGGRFTTIEGLLDQIHDELRDKVPFIEGDSAESERKQVLAKLLDNIMKIRSGELKVTLILEDPLASSYIQNIYAPDPDPEMEIEDYERTEEENDFLGISDMRV